MIGFNVMNCFPNSKAVVKCEQNMEWTVFRNLKLLSNVNGILGFNIKQDNFFNKINKNKDHFHFEIKLYLFTWMMSSAN